MKQIFVKKGDIIPDEFLHLSKMIEEWPYTQAIFTEYEGRFYIDVIDWLSFNSYCFIQDKTSKLEMKVMHKVRDWFIMRMDDLKRGTVKPITCYEFQLLYLQNREDEVEKGTYLLCCGNRFDPDTKKWKMAAFKCMDDIYYYKDHHDEYRYNAVLRAGYDFGDLYGYEPDI